MSVSEMLNASLDHVRKANNSTDLSLIKPFALIRFSDSISHTLDLLQISPEDSPLKSTNENSTDEKMRPPKEMQTEVPAYQSVTEPPKIPSPPLDGITAAVIKSPGDSGASDVLDQELRKERTASDRKQQVKRLFHTKCSSVIA